MSVLRKYVGAAQETMTGSKDYYGEKTLSYLLFMRAIFYKAPDDDKKTIVWRNVWCSVRFTSSVHSPPIQHTESV